MYFRNFLLIIIVFFDILINGNCLKEYEKLEIKDNPSIKLKDLPNEFSLNAFKIIDEFIKKQGILNMNVQYILITSPVKFLNVLWAILMR